MSASAARGDVPLETSAPGALRSPHGRSDDKKQNDLSYLLYLEKKGSDANNRPDGNLSGLD